MDELPSIQNKRRASPSTWFIIIGWTVWFFIGFLANLSLFKFGFLSSIVFMLTVFGLIFRVKARKVDLINKQSSLLSIWFPSIGWSAWIFISILLGIDFTRSFNVFVFSSLIVFVLMTLGLVFGVKAGKSGMGLPGLILSILGLIFLALVILSRVILSSLGGGLW